MNPETKDEKRTRELKELEGKNISHYCVLLQTIIQSELHSVKTIITLSSVAIVLLFTVVTFKGSCTIIGPIVFGTSVFFFIVTIVFGLLFLNQASTRYEEELKGANNKKQWNSLVKTRKKFSIYRKGAFITFVLGIVVGVAFGVIRFYEKLF
jgi:hypothetical protein